MNNAQIIFAMLAFATIVGVLATLHLSIAKRKRAAVNVLPFLRTNFAALANTDGIVTAASLAAAKKAFPANRTEIAIVAGELDTIGHKIGDDNQTKGAVAVSLAVSSPMMTPLAMAGDYSVFGISQDDLARVSRLEASAFGKISVWKFRASK